MPGRNGWSLSRRSHGPLFCMNACSRARPSGVLSRCRSMSSAGFPAHTWRRNRASISFDASMRRASAARSPAGSAETSAVRSTGARRAARRSSFAASGRGPGDAGAGAGAGAAHICRSPRRREHEHGYQQQPRRPWLRHGRTVARRRARFSRATRAPAAGAAGACCRWRTPARCRGSRRSRDRRRRIRPCTADRPGRRTCPA